MSVDKSAVDSTTLTIDFSLVPAQAHAFEAWKPGVRVCNAFGRGAGKSYFARMAMYLLINDWDGVRRKTSTGTRRGIRIFYLFPTLKHFRRLGHMQNMVDELGPHGMFGFLGCAINQSEWTFSFPGGSTIQVLTAEASNRGARADAAVLDEADEIPIATFESEVLPWFTEPWSLKMVLITGTPLMGRYGLLWKAFSVWPYGDAEHEPVPDCRSFHATVYDADPAVVDRREAERAKATISPTRFSTEYMCNFDSGEGLVYPFFDIGFHVKPPPAFSEFHEFIVGVDHGFEDPTVFLVIGVAGHGKDTIGHILHEEWHVGASVTELTAVARGIEQRFPGAKWYADHAPSINKTLHDDAGVDIVEAEKGPGSVEDGVAMVADWLFVRSDYDEATGVRLQWSHLYVDPRCKHTIEEFGKYRRKRDSRNHQRVLDAIDTSRNDHGMDAVRYALFSHFIGPERRIERGLKLR